MPKVYMVKAVKSYEIEIVANDEEEAMEYANEHNLLDWVGCDFEITNIEFLSNNAKDWFGPDRSDEI
jgi:formylmethanofuran dehydrogenase subunit A